MRKAMHVGATAILAAFFALAAATVVIALNAGDGVEEAAGANAEGANAEGANAEGANAEGANAEGANIIEIEFDGDDGRPEWEVEVVGADGLLREVSVDAQSGEVIGAKTEEPEGEEGEMRVASVGIREAEAAALDSLHGADH